MKNLTLKFVLTFVLGLGLAFAAEAQTVKGVVKDATGEPVIGAAVVVEGTTLGVSTGVDGSFTLNLPDAKNNVLLVSYIGMKEARVAVVGKTSVEVTLEEDATGIEDVVVVGYGVMKKSDLTGSVGSVAAEDIAARGTVRLEEALQGSVPGVNITQSNSRAGGSFSMQIRGQSSITKSNDPLYVIDGIVSSSMDFLNPEDIERVDVLKDASSTAIYGSRASGGVIMITTKGSKGASKAHQMTVSYDGYYGVRDVARMPDFMDTKEFMNYRFARYMEYADKSNPGDGAGHPIYVLSNPTSVFPVASGTDYKQSLIFQRYMENKTYDWANEVLRTASQQNHYLSLEGASESTSYRFGVGYQSEENVFVENDYQRLNLKGAFDSKLSKVVELGMSANLAYTLQDDFTTDGSNSYSPYNNAFWFAPVLSPWDDNGDLYAIPGKPGVSGISFTSTPNPLIDFQLPNAYVNQTRKFHVFGNFYVRLNLYDGLKFTTTFSPNFYHGRQGVFFGTGVTEQFPSGSAYYQNKKYNSASVVNTDRLDWTWDNQIDYNKTWGDHSLSAMGLFSMYASNKETYEMSGRNISDDKLTYHALGKAGSEGMAINSAYTESSLVSFAARANYSYKGKYMATVTFRADGSSRFAKDNRWGYFPSAALAWRMSEENWMKNASWLDNLKLRVSYGVTGNNNVGDYVTASTASGPSYVIIGGQEVQGYYPNGLIDAGLVWEEVKEFDAGVDFSAFNGRLGVTADAYSRLSDGQIMNSTVPVETGETSITTNIGSIRNAGIELGFNFGVVRSKNFTWDVNVNFSRNWSKIKELPNGDDYGKNWFIGERINVLRDYKHTDVISDKGVTMHTQEGDIHYTLQEVYDKYGWMEGEMGVHDWNNDGKISDDDKQIFGCTDPTWMGSLSSSMAFKGFDFSFTIYTKQGQWSRSYFHEQYMDYNDRGRQKFNFDYYIPAGAYVLNENGDIVQLTESKPGKYPYPTNADKTAGGWFSSKGSAKQEGYQYHDTSFVKVKNICLGYTFPKAWMKKIHVKNLRIYVNVLNPFCWTEYDGFDPEWAGASLVNGGPASVTYQFGANLKF